MGNFTDLRREPGGYVGGGNCPNPLTRLGDLHVPLSIVLTSTALLLAVPFGLLVMLVAFQATGPCRRRGSGVRLPDLSDDLLCPSPAN
jgi:hypothetical protein